MNLPALNRRRKASVLVAEDESIVRADVEDYLKSFGYRVAASVASGEEAKRQATKLRPDLVLMDIILSGKVDGIEAGKYIQRKLGIPVVFVTAHGDERTLERAKLNAPFGYVLKPFNDRELRTAIEIAIFRHRAEEELVRLHQWLKAIVNSMDEAVVVTDKWGFITLFNECAAALTGWKPQKAVGKALGQVVQFFHGENRQPVLLPLNEALLQSSGKASHEQLVLASAKGAETPVRFSIASMTDSNGEINGVILKFQAFELGSSSATEAEAATKPSTRATRSGVHW
jgi:PAS domain S-box-containing protein